MKSEANLPTPEGQRLMSSAENDGDSFPGEGKLRSRAVALCLAVMVLMGAVAASVAFADSSTEGVSSSFNTFAASPTGLADATTGAIPVAAPEPSGTALGPHELEDLGRPEAEGVLEEVFGPSLEGPAQALDELDVEEFRSDHVAVVAPPAGSEQSPRGLLSSVLPLRAEDDQGRKGLVDLDLEGVEGHFESENPLVPVEIPAELSEGITFPESGIAVNVVSGQGQRDSSLAGDASVFFPNVAHDSDLVITPTSLGVETYTQLRSGDSPRTQAYNLDLPANFYLRATNDGGAEAVNSDGHVVLTVLPPSAVDAEGAVVPAGLEVDGDSIRVSVEAEPDAAYPILVDPVFEQYAWGTSPPPAGTSSMSWSAFSNQGFWTLTSGPKPGLTAEAEAGATSPGNQAYYNAFVPRYWRDLQNGFEKPTSYIRDMKLWSLTFMMPMESSNFGSDPFMYVGLWDGNKNAFVSYGARYGNEGQATDVNWVYDLSNPNEVVDAKQGGFGIATRTSYNNYFRYVNAQQASVEVTDKDSPAFGELGAVSSWVSSGTGPAINYKISDPGLGVRELRLRYPAAGGATGENITYAKSTANGSENCSGAAFLPCPRTTSTSNTPIGYNPAQIAQGENRVQVYGVDPVGHWSTAGESRIKVDHTAPGLALSGNLTEQTSVGTKLPEYTLNYSATDGDDAAATAQAPFGTVGSAAGQVQRPLGAAVDAEGNMWITDITNNRVLEYDKGGRFVRQIGTSDGGAGAATGQFNSPRGIAIAPNGKVVWVADYGNKRLQAFTSQGVFIRQVAGPAGTPLEGPYGIAVANDGSVWVSDIITRKIRHFSETGGFLGTASGSPSGSTQGLAIDAFGNIWANEYETNKIYELTSTGAPKFSFGGTEGTGNGVFKGPVGIAIAPSGNIFVVDDLSNRIQEFKPDGTFLRTFGAEGSASNQLKEPRLLAVGPENTLYVADATNHRIARWTHADQDPQSGAAKLEIKVDGSVAKTTSPGCGTKNCAISGSWILNANNYSAGTHKVEVVATDGVGLPTTKTLNIETHGDLVAPSLALSGTMTEQATTSTTRNKYILKASATDTGTAAEWKSGVVATTIKVDGKLVDSYSAPCATEGCSVTREWTMLSSEYLGPHKVQVTATDGAGHVTTKELSVQIDPDVTPPAISTGSEPFFTRPQNWLEQKTYAYSTTATDEWASGVVKFVFKIDGVVLKQAENTCSGGSCSRTLAGEINIDNYAGGAHGAELIATDAAGNQRKRSWTINVNPKGQVSASEAEATLEAFDNTTSENTVGPSESESDYEGTADELELQPSEEVFIATGAATPSEVPKAEAGEITLTIPTPVGGVSCSNDQVENHAEALSGAEEEALAINASCQNPTFGAAPSVETIKIVPVVSNEGTQMLVDEASAAIAPNVTPNADLVTRPLFDGSQTFAAIRDTSGPTSFAWHVNMESAQEMKLLDPQHAAVYYKDGGAAFSITATPAHDAIGTSVPTSLTVAGDVLTLTVNHHAASYVYPVVGGAGWEGGFTTYQIAMPPPELPPEEAPAEEDELQVLGAGYGLYKDMQYGPPVFLSNGSDGIPERKRAYNFHDCAFLINGEDIPVPTLRGLIKDKCHNNSENNDASVKWAFSIHGVYTYKRGQWAWDPDGPDSCKPWGPDRPAEVHCRATSNLKAVNLDVLGDYRFAPGRYMDEFAPGQATCYQIDGVLPNWYRQDYPGEKVLVSHYYENRKAVWPDKSCPWNDLDRVGG